MTTKLVQPVKEEVLFLHRKNHSMAAWPHTVIVDNETGIYAGPGEGYSRKGTPGKGDKFEVLRRREGWVQCRSDQFDTGRIQGDAN